MKKILSVVIASLVLFASPVQAGMLNMDTFLNFKQMVDNAKDTSNYRVGAYLNRSERTSSEYYALSLYDFTGTEEIPLPEGESQKVVIPYFSIEGGYATPNQGVLSLTANADGVASYILRNAPFIEKANLDIPEKLNITIGYGLSYDFDIAQNGEFDTSAVGYGITVTGSIAYKF